MPRGKAAKSLALIDTARRILAEIQPATIRAVCYRLFTAGVLPDMSKASTNRVSTQLVYAREQGLIPWHWIVDETREAERVPSWADPAEYADVVRRSYRRDAWTMQPRRVEVWSEKGTVRGTLAPVLDEYGVTFRVMHGYSSATTLYQVARETAHLASPLLALYVGDWDPSGLHMSHEDLPARLAEYGANVELERVALTASDIASGNLPSFPVDTKCHDPRFRWYTTTFRLDRSWELDALNPTTLRERVARRIAAEIDRDAWEQCARVEAAERESLVRVLSAWKPREGRTSYGMASQEIPDPGTRGNHQNTR